MFDKAECLRMCDTCRNDNDFQEIDVTVECQALWDIGDVVRFYTVLRNIYVCSETLHTNGQSLNSS